MSNNKNINMMRTPLRNSNLANKPFCSPFKSNLTPVKEGLKRLHSPSTQMPLTPVTPDENIIIKRRRIENEDSENSCKQLSGSRQMNTTKNNLMVLKKRVRCLRQEIESVKVKLAYRNKHKNEDLKEAISTWRQACHRVLIEYQKECTANSPDGKIVEIENILLNLGIPEEVVKFPEED